jgi:hypothetical protein
MSEQQVKSNKDTHRAVAVFPGLIFTPSLDCLAPLSSAKETLEVVENPRETLAE